MGRRLSFPSLKPVLEAAVCGRYGIPVEYTTASDQVMMKAGAAVNSYKVPALFHFGNSQKDVEAAKTDHSPYGSKSKAVTEIKIFKTFRKALRVVRNACSLSRAISWLELFCCCGQITIALV